MRRVVNCAQDPSCLSVCARELEKSIIKKGPQERSYCNLVLVALNLLFLSFRLSFPSVRVNLAVQMGVRVPIMIAQTHRTELKFSF